MTHRFYFINQSYKLGFVNKLTRQLKNELVLYSLMPMMVYDDFTIQCQA